jgi:hypothetical protein
MKKLFLCVLFGLVAISALAGSYSNRIYDPQIKSLQAVVNNNWTSLPVMRLYSNDVLNISFDELSHDYHRYVYKITKCEADWKVSEDVFESDYLEGFNGNTIDEFEHSTNTIIPYTHYRLQIPNDKCRLKMSGNYVLEVTDEDTDTTMLRVPFMVCEQSMKLSMSVSPNTDIDNRQSHQQVSMAVNYGQLPVTNPEEQIYAVVMQNHQDFDIRTNVPANLNTNNGMEWSHQRDLIFDGGNEYHKFEVLDVSHPTMGIDHIIWDGENYQVYLPEDHPRANYLYDEDADGSFYIRNSDNIANDTQSEYVWVNFRLDDPGMSDTPMITGRWACEDINVYGMVPNEGNNRNPHHFYSASILLKQGYYNYQYRNTNGKLHHSEGSFYQTENRYQGLIYYKGTNDRSWRLTAFGDIAAE